MRKEEFKVGSLRMWYMRNLGSSAPVVYYPVADAKEAHYIRGILAKADQYDASTVSNLFGLEECISEEEVVEIYGEEELESYRDEGTGLFWTDYFDGRGEGW